MSTTLQLQHCPECGCVQYPRREVCQNCLSPRLEWRDTSGAGRLLSWTSLRASVEPAFQDRLPLNIALVELDAGPVLYAFADAGLDQAGMQVEVTSNDENILTARRKQ